MPIEDVKELASRIPGLRPTLNDEAKTKQFLILPVIQSLGYDILNHEEVVPEYTVDYEGREGWKVDYGLMSDGNPRIIIECKPISNRLELTEIAQLGRYFTNARRKGAQIAILTNGVIYKLFTDQNAPNIMDRDPFWEINFENLNNNDLIQLRNISKENFDPASAIQTALRLKHIDWMKEILSTQFSQPEDDFVRWLANRVSTRRLTQPVLEEFRILVRQSLHEFVNSHISNALMTVQAGTLVREDDGSDDGIPAENDAESRNIETTVEELDAFAIIKSIAGDIVDPKRIIIRDAQTYCAVLVDNNRKPLCRFYFNGAQRRLGLFDGTRASSGALIVTQHDIASVDGIHAYADQIRETARRHLES